MTLHRPPTFAMNDNRAWCAALAQPLRDIYPVITEPLPVSMQTLLDALDRNEHPTAAEALKRH